MNSTPELGRDHFALLGQPRTHALDPAAVEQAYLDRAAALHPDRFVGASPAERRQAMEASARVNEAYRTLRDPVRRAEYLVKLGGIDLDSHAPGRGAPTMPREFLVDMMEQRDRLEAARQRAEEGPGSASALGDPVEELRDSVDADFDHALRRAVECVEAGEIQAAAEKLVVCRYLQRLLDEIDNLPT